MKRFILITLTLLFLWPGITSAQGRGYGGGNWHLGPGMMFGWGMGWVMILFWILILVVLVLLIRWLIIATRREAHPSSRHKNALAILNERFARGEIQKAEC